jgi:hypothetical protein
MKRRTLPIAAALIFIALFGMLLIREPLQHKVFSFLSLNRPIKAEVLVIEGWLTDRMLKEAALEFLRGSYSYCLVTGSGKTHSSRIPMNVLMRFGLDSVAVKSTDAETGKGHNTYHLALAARQWLQINDPKVSTLNVFTAGPHGRKSWILFKRVLGKNFSVGVLSSSVEQRDTDLWWGSKQGMRNMAKYGIGYLYAQLWLFEK